MYTSRPCALGRKQSNEGLGDCLQKTSQRQDAFRLLKLFVSDSVGAPGRGRLHRAGLGFYCFTEELENRWKTLPGRELVPLCTCKTQRARFHSLGAVVCSAGPGFSPARGSEPLASSTGTANASTKCHHSEAPWWSLGGGRVLR